MSLTNFLRPFSMALGTTKHDEKRVSSGTEPRLQGADFFGSGEILSRRARPGSRRHCRICLSRLLCCKSILNLLREAGDHLTNILFYSRNNLGMFSSRV